MATTVPVGVRPTSTATRSRSVATGPYGLRTLCHRGSTASSTDPDPSEAGGKTYGLRPLAESQPCAA